MPHHCKFLVLHCIDFRLGKPLKKYLEEKGLLGNCDLASLAGSVKNLLSPKEDSDRDFVLRQIEISSNLHHIQEVILINHTDCGAYGQSSNFGSSQEEREFHIKEMEKGKELIQRKFPGIKVSLVLAKINHPDSVDFEEISR